MSESTQQPLLILGMHRSGTSFLARLMQTLGVFIGDQLVGPQRGNPRGHFEARPVLEFHQNLINRRIASTRRAFDDGMLVQSPLRGDYTEEEIREAGELVSSMERDGFWGWKEPRTCLFLDLWQKILPEAMGVIVYRHPLDVHQSLLRREHWDLALFPDQAMRAYTLYNRCLLDSGLETPFIFNANAGFSDVKDLTARLSAAFGLNPAEDLPEFHRTEFKMLRVSPALHQLTGLIYPEAVEAFEAFQDRTAIPYTWEERDDDSQLEEIYAQMAPVVSGLPPEGRAFLGPLLDWWASDRDPAVFDLYATLGEEIGGRVRRVEEWNREAAQIFKENERLSADYERMGKEFAKQQAFLAKQASTQAKVWEELTRTGDSWIEQRDLIKTLLEEKRGLLDEIRQLKEGPGPGGDAES